MVVKGFRIGCDTFRFIPKDDYSEDPYIIRYISCY